MSPRTKASPIVVKRYGRQRLYDPANQRYVSADQLRDWAEHGVTFMVKDTETGEDVTQVLLA